MISTQIIDRYWGSYRVRSYAAHDPLVLPRGWSVNPRWPDWFSTCKPGDVVLTGRGTERLIRYTHRSADPRRKYYSKLWFVFSILRCSWTEACYTCYGSTDILTMGYSHTGLSLPMRSEMDIRIREELLRCDLSVKNARRQMSCCDVEGVR